MRSQSTDDRLQPRKLLHRKALAQRSTALRTAGLRLVLTNGCFDLLHVGHIRYLQQARALGDRLAVGVNGDASVRRIKGSGRPLTPDVERAEILCALQCVDYVTIFEEDTALELVRSIHPAIYVKGGDYSSDPASPTFPPEGHAVTASGGLVRTIEYVPGKSTSEILRRLQASVP